MEDLIHLSQNNINLTKETATSTIFFTRDKIYKVKKNITLYPFIDYSTKDKRFVKIDKEFMKGIKYSPEVYICQGILNGPNIKEEPFLCMRRGNLSSKTLFEFLSSNNTKAFSLYDVLRKIKLFHNQTDEISISSKHSILSLRKRFSMLCEEALMVDNKLDSYYLQLMDELIHSYELSFQERFANGKIRELHGDLHSGNILFDGEIYYFFDFLDFEDNYTTGDYLYDVGFLLADMYFFDVIKIESSEIEKIAEFFNDETSLLLLFSAFGALNRSNVFAYDKLDKANLFHKISYMLLCKGIDYL